MGSASLSAGPFEPSQVGKGNPRCVRLAQAASRKAGPQNCVDDDLCLIERSRSVVGFRRNRDGQGKLAFERAVQGRDGLGSRRLGCQLLCRFRGYQRNGAPASCEAFRANPAVASVVARACQHAYAHRTSRPGAHLVCDRFARTVHEACERCAAFGDKLLKLSHVIDGKCAQPRALGRKAALRHDASAAQHAVQHHERSAARRCPHAANDQRDDPGHGEHGEHRDAGLGVLRGEGCQRARLGSDRAASHFGKQGEQPPRNPDEDEQQTVSRQVVVPRCAPRPRAHDAQVQERLGGSAALRHHGHDEEHDDEGDKYAQARRQECIAYLRGGRLEGLRCRCLCANRGCNQA